MCDCLRVFYPRAFTFNSITKLFFVRSIPEKERNETRAKLEASLFVRLILAINNAADAISTHVDMWKAVDAF